MADDDRRAEIEAVARALAELDGEEPAASWRNYERQAGAALAALDRVRDARGGDEARCSIEEHDGMPGYWVCERCGQPLSADGRCNSGLHVGPGEDANGMAIHTTDLAALAARSQQGEDHEGWRCPIHGQQQDMSRRCPECDRPLAPPGQPAVDYATQGEDHEVGRKAAREAVSDEFRRKPNGWSDQSVADAAVAAYLSRVSPSRPEQPPPDALGGQPPAEPETP